MMGTESGPSHGRKYSFGSLGDLSAPSKRIRSGSISGRLRAASDLEDIGMIDKNQKGIIKDLIISGDNALQAALDKYERGDPHDMQILIQQGLLARKQSIDLLDGLDLDFLSVGNYGNFGLGAGGDVNGSFGLDDDILFSHHFDEGIDSLETTGNAADFFRPSSGSFAMSLDDAPSAGTASGPASGPASSSSAAAALASAATAGGAGGAGGVRGSSRSSSRSIKIEDVADTNLKTHKSSGSDLGVGLGLGIDSNNSSGERYFLRRASIDQTKLFLGETSTGGGAVGGGLTGGRDRGVSRGMSLSYFDDIDVDLSAYESLAASLQQKDHNKYKQQQQGQEQEYPKRLSPSSTANQHQHPRGAATAVATSATVNSRRGNNTETTTTTTNKAKPAAASRRGGGGILVGAAIAHAHIPSPLPPPSAATNTNTKLSAAATAAAAAAAAAYSKPSSIAHNKAGATAAAAAASHSMPAYLTHPIATSTATSGAGRVLATATVGTMAGNISPRGGVVSSSAASGGVKVLPPAVKAVPGALGLSGLGQGLGPGGAASGLYPHHGTGGIGGGGSSLLSLGAGGGGGGGGGGPFPFGYIGSYSPDARRERIARFVAKRDKRVWTKKVKYDVRKNFADSRLRVKGRFVKKEDEEIMRELQHLV